MIIKIKLHLCRTHDHKKGGISKMIRSFLCNYFSLNKPVKYCPIVGK